MIASGNMRAWDSMTKNGTIEKMNVIEEKIECNKAVVYFTLSFKDGTRGKFKQQLIKESGGWKLDFY